MTYEIGDGPIEKQYRENINALANGIDTILNGKATGNDRKTGFALLVFEFGGRNGRCNFITNGADKRDLIVLFKEMIARFEGQPDISGRA